MLDDQALDTTPDDAAPTDDPYGLRGLTFADLPSQPGDGLLGGVMRQMAANGHPGLQEWAANDAAMRAGASQPQSLWDSDGAAQAPPAQPSAGGTAQHACRIYRGAKEFLL